MLNARSLDFVLTHMHISDIGMTHWWIMVHFKYLGKIILLFTGSFFFISDCFAASFSNEQLKFTEDLYKKVFSETDIFYAPGGNEAVPLISKSTGTNDRGPKGVYGWLPCFCFIEACSCCVDVQIRSLNIRDTGCATISPSYDDNSSIDAGLAFNNRTLIEERMSFENAPPLCIPFPPFPAISICLRLNQIMRDGRNIKACVNFELRITGTLNPLWTLQFTCVRFGFSGISFFRPTITTTSTTTPSPTLPQTGQQEEENESQEGQSLEQQYLMVYPSQRESPRLGVLVAQQIAQPIPLALQMPIPMPALHYL